MGPLALDASFSIQLTVGVLSHNVPSGTCLTFGATDSATATAMTSAANSRSEFVRRPFGLSSDTTSEAMSCGNPTRHTVGDMLSISENQTPPAPSAAASWYPTYCGMSGTNSLTCVGREARMRTRVHRSSNAALTSDLAPKMMCIGDPFIAALIGVKKPRAAGRIMDACLSFPTTL